MDIQITIISKRANRDIMVKAKATTTIKDNSNMATGVKIIQTREVVGIIGVITGTITVTIMHQMEMVQEASIGGMNDVLYYWLFL